MLQEIANSHKMVLGVHHASLDGPCEVFGDPLKKYDTRVDVILRLKKGGDKRESEHYDLILRGGGAMAKHMKVFLTPVCI
jgi:hypothetical protein